MNQAEQIEATVMMVHSIGLDPEDCDPDVIYQAANSVVRYDSARDENSTQILALAVLKRYQPDTYQSLITELGEAVDQRTLLRAQ